VERFDNLQGQQDFANTYRMDPNRTFSLKAAKCSFPEPTETLAKIARQSPSLDSLDEEGWKS